MKLLFITLTPIFCSYVGLLINSDPNANTPRYRCIKGQDIVSEPMMRGSVAYVRLKRRYEVTANGARTANFDLVGGYEREYTEETKYCTGANSCDIVHSNDSFSARSIARFPGTTEDKDTLYAIGCTESQLNRLVSTTSGNLLDSRLIDFYALKL